MGEERRPYNAVSDFVDANIDRGLAEKVAFTDPERTLTYGELAVATCLFAEGLRSIGLRQESRIALLLPDSVDYPVVFWGAIRAGVVPIPLNTVLTPDQYAYILADARPEMIVITPALLEPIAPLLKGASTLGSAIIVGANNQSLADLGHVVPHRLADVLAYGTARRWAALTGSDEVAFWLYSSGSTGPPKGVKHVHSSLMATARLYGEGVLGMHADDVIFSAAKLFFAYGLGNAMSFPMSVGASAILVPDRPTPDLVLKIMQRYRPSIFFGVPTLYAALIGHDELGPGAGSDRLRRCVSAGEALPPHVGERWRERVGVELLDGIGSTEMLHIFLSNRPGEVRYGTTGRVVPGYEAKIVDEHGRELGNGEIGELVIRGPSAAEGYWCQRAKTRRTFVGEWTHTGDKYVRESDGYYRYCGRTDDMFKVSGVWVSPFEVEAALLSHEAVLEAAVVGKKNREGLTKPKAFVVLKPGYAADERLFQLLKAHVKQRAGRSKYPRWISVRAELPKTATGKIQRFRLREDDEAAGR
jgi:4-hydroxybenzoate-CoA ligase